MLSTITEFLQNLDIQSDESNVSGFVIDTSICGVQDQKELFNQLIAACDKSGLKIILTTITIDELDHLQKRNVDDSSHARNILKFAVDDSFHFKAVEVDKEFNVEIAKLPYELTDENVRSKSTALGNFVSDIVASSQDGIDIALINSGSLRGKLPSGKVTLGNMYEFFPFDNLIILTTLKGKDLKTILELSASRKGEGAFLQVSKDCIINFDSKGKLLESYIKGRTINDNDKYVVAVADYIFNGGEKYIDESGKPLFQYGENIIHTGLDIRDLIITTLKEYKNVHENAIDNTERIIFK